jgi:hypothetical protein
MASEEKGVTIHTFDRAGSTQGQVLIIYIRLFVLTNLLLSRISGFLSFVHRPDSM